METVQDPHLRHLFHGVPIFNVYNQDVCNLSVGAPGPDLLKNCGDILLKATEHRTKAEKDEGKYYLYQYGITPGLWECREELAKFLTRRYGDEVTRESLILSYGATSGLQLLLSTIVAPNGIIFVEEATYMIALDVMRQFPMMKIVTVSMKNDVVDLDSLEEAIEKHKDGSYLLNHEKLFWAIFYTIPTYHNPTGMVLPPDDCKRLVEIARKHSIAVACDDVYNILHYDEGLPPHRLFFYDDPEDPGYKGGNIISNGSFSKILSPAIRLGWMECSPRVVNVFKNSGTLKSGGGLNHYLSGVITSLLSLGYEDRHVDMLIEVYKDRLKALCDTLDRYLPSCCSYRRPSGGYFVWIHLPNDIDGREVVRFCEDHYKVTAIPGARFSSTGEMKNFLRLSIGFHKSEVLKNATKLLCEGMLQYIRTRKATEKDEK